MNILLLAENWPPREGGIEHYLTHIAGLLPKKSVTVTAPALGKEGEEPSTHHVIGNGIKTVIRKRFFWPVIKPSFWPLQRFVLKLAQTEKFDVTICGKALFEGQVALTLKKKLGIPYILCTYAMEIEVWANASSTKKKLIKVLQGADRVLYINDVTKKKLLELGATEKQLVKVWPGVDDRFFLDISEKEIQRVLQKYHVRQPYIFSMARLIHRKGMDLLIEGFASLNQMHLGNVQLVIGGTGPEEKHLKEVMGHNFIDTSVNLIGHVADEDLPALYKGASLFALVPRNDKTDMEGFGVVYLEAAATGVSSLGTTVGGVPEAVLDGKTGTLVAPEDEKAITETLTSLLTNKEMRETLGKAAKERAWNEFRWSKRILLVKSVIDVILAEKILQAGKK